MVIHEDELALAQAYQASHDFEHLTPTQMNSILARGRELFHWFKAHPWIHNTINLGVVVSLLTLDYVALVEMPGYILVPGGNHDFIRILLASAIAGSVHSFLMYSLSVLSLHEAASHHIVFVGQSWFARFADRLSANLARLAAAEPEHYSANHMAHHAKFGTAEDAEFLNFVVARRYFMTWLPMAAIINFSDFIAHRPPTYTGKRILSAAVAAVYNLIYAALTYPRYGLAFVLLTMFVFLPHVGFALDRVRQFTEHNLMPLENKNGARSFGIGFWGLLIGGGPWGQPCHWEHHLVPSLPWYQQLLLHRHVKNILTPRQREQFLITPVIGFPRLWWRIIHETGMFRPVSPSDAGPRAGQRARV